MQNILLALAILALTSISVSAQCDKKVNWHASKVEMLNADGEVQDSKTGTILIETQNKEIHISIAEAPTQALEGVVIEMKCNWQEAFKNGTTVYSTEFTGGRGQKSNGTLTIEAKDGKLVGILKLNQEEGKVFRILVDKYEVKE